MSREYKTSQKHRTRYIYYPVDGPRIALSPGENGVTETDIQLLHAIDDAWVDEDRRNEYHTRTLNDHLETRNDGHRRNQKPIPIYTDLIDVFVAAEAEARHQERLSMLATAMETLLPQQLELFKKVYIDQRTYTNIASEEGVTEAAIRNRLHKMHTRLRKHFQA